MERIRQKINCKVYDCKHCNCDENECNLQEIKIRNCFNEQSKEATMCKSYDKRIV